MKEQVSEKLAIKILRVIEDYNRIDVSFMIERLKGAELLKQSSLDKAREIRIDQRKAYQYDKCEIVCKLDHVRYKIKLYEQHIKEMEEGNAE